MVRQFFAVSMVALLATIALAEDDRQVPVSVTSVAGTSVFLDKGQDHGLEPGLRVRLFPVGAPSVEGVIRDVSSGSARAEMPVGVTGLLVGTTGEVTVPTPATEADAGDPDAPPEREVPEHPPWTRQEGDRAPGQPLLAPAYSVRPSDRAPTVRGRLYSQFYLSQDRGDGRDSDFINARIGLRTTISNPLGHGGRLLMAGQTDYRSTDLGNLGDESDTEFILDRLSYAVGGEAYAPYRLELGRFYSVHAPELGLIDGVEGVLQMEGSLKLGLAVGAYPRPFPDRDWGDDIGFHVFMNYVATGDSHLDATVGYQKTWHEGDSDRDLVFGRVNLRPTKKLWLYGSWKLDVYTGSDTIKGSGADLTEAYLQIRYALTTDTGATVSYSRYTWPELQRREYQFLPADLVQDGEVDRLDLNAWWQMASDLRLTGRVNHWEDQDSDGTGGELNLRWSNFLNVLSSLEAAVYVAEGAFTEGIGYRVRARQRFDGLDVYVGYELFDYETRRLGAGEEDFIRQSVRGGINWRVKQWSYNLTGDYYFGDSEDLISIGAYIQYSF